MRLAALALLAVVAAATLNGPAEAYIGPGAGISLLGAFWGLILAVTTAVAAVVWYPIRKLMRSRPAARRPEASFAPRTTPARER